MAVLSDAQYSVRSREGFVQFDRARRKCHRLFRGCIRRQALPLVHSPASREPRRSGVSPRPCGIKLRRSFEAFHALVKILDRSLFPIVFSLQIHVIRLRIHGAVKAEAQIPRLARAELGVCGDGPGGLRLHIYDVPTFTEMFFGPKVLVVFRLYQLNRDSYFFA